MGDRKANTLLFLPGASGNTRFWKPVSDGLQHSGVRRFVAWPGFGGVPPEPGVRGLDDLVGRVVAAISGPVDVLAQSMGGVIAIRAALRKPDLVRHLVLSVTSGGLDVASLGGADWRPTFREHNPTLPSWFEDESEDLTDRLGELSLPVLLLWGDADPISPVAVGRRLAELLPRAELVIFEKGTHDLVFDRANEVIPYIEKHLAA
ncbi:MAG: alpha/beta fold hydrolase [Candidatus Rokubacteria bacterium]|nr:alpha/beta fold hydrolase [Candidatus Rokubacteria bacterium]